MHFCLGKCLGNYLSRIPKRSQRTMLSYYWSILVDYDVIVYPQRIWRRNVWNGRKVWVLFSQFGEKNSKIWTNKDWNIKTIEIWLILPDEGVVYPVKLLQKPRLTDERQQKKLRRKKTKTSHVDNLWQGISTNFFSKYYSFRSEEMQKQCIINWDN